MTGLRFAAVYTLLHFLDVKTPLNCLGLAATYLLNLSTPVLPLIALFFHTSSSVCTSSLCHLLPI